MMLGWMKDRKKNVYGFWMAFAITMGFLLTFGLMFGFTEEYTFLTSFLFIGGIWLGTFFFVDLVAFLSGEDIFDNGRIPFLLSLGSILAIVLSFAITSFFMGPVINILPWQALLVFAFLMTEIFFWIDDEEPKKKQSKFVFTIYKKFDALLDAVAILIFAQIVRLIIIYLKLEWVIAVIKFIGWLTMWFIQVCFLFTVLAGIVLIIIAIFCIYIKLNQTKYGEDKPVKKRGKK